MESLELIEFNLTKQCRACGSKDLSKVIHFNNVPLAGDFKLIGDNTLRKLPLTLVQCQKCSLMQVLEKVDPKILFSNYSYGSSSNKELVKHFHKEIELILPYISKKDLIVEIGCNDGVILKKLKEKGFSVIGVDPSDVAYKASKENGFSLYNYFLTSEVAKDIVSKYGKAKLIIANNMFAHLNNFSPIMEAIDILLEKDGIFSLEVHYQRDLIEQRQFDTIYHEHTCYHNLKTLSKITSYYNLYPFDCYRISSHSGSIHVNFSREAEYHQTESLKKILEEEKKLNYNSSEVFKIFNKAIEDIRNKFYLLKDKGNSICAYGASGRGAMLLNICGLDHNDIIFATDLSPLRINHYIPGTKIPILNRDELKKNKCDIYFVLAWNYINQIVSDEREFLSKGGEILTPLPYPKLITKSNAKEFFI